MLVPLSYNLRSLFVRRATTAAAALGIALVVFVLASSLMLGKGIRNTFVSNGSPGRALVLRKGADAEMSSSIESQTVSLLKAAPGIKRGEDGESLVSPEVVVVVALDKVGSGGDYVSNILVRGVSPVAMRVRPEVHVVEGRAARPGTDEAIVGQGVRGRFEGLELGSSFELRKNRAVTVVGVFESGGSSLESEVWVAADAVRDSMGRGSTSTSVTLALESAAAYDGFATYVEHDKQLGLQSMRESEYYEKQSEGTSVFITALGSVIAFFFSLGAMIGAMITMYGSVAHRAREVGTLRALGFSRFAIVIAFLFESTVLALMGACIGALASLAMSAASFSTMNMATWQEVSFSFDPTLSILTTAVVAGGVMGMLGGFFPAVRAARLSPLQALRG